MFLPSSDLHEMIKIKEKKPVVHLRMETWGLETNLITTKIGEGVEHSRLEDQGQGDRKIRSQGQGQHFQGQTLWRPRTGMLKTKAKSKDTTRKWVFAPKFCKFSGKLKHPSRKKSVQNFFRKLSGVLHYIAKLVMTLVHFQLVKK